MKGLHYRGHVQRRSAWIFSPGAGSPEEPPKEADKGGKSVTPAAPVIAFLDDDEALLETVSLALRAFGLEVHSFSTPETLEQALTLQHFDSFIIDWRLGERTAAETIRRLRAMPRYAKTPTFILSGNIPVADTDWDKDMVNLLSSHQVKYRAKPYSSKMLASEILASVREAIRNH
jgi:DNA-binding response OmpR family regulator